MKNKSTMYLLFNLMGIDAASKLPPSYQDIFDGDANSIIDVLNTRYSKEFAHDFDVIYKWFISSESPLSKNDIERLMRIHEMKSGEREFLDVFNEILKEK